MKYLSKLIFLLSFTFGVHDSKACDDILKAFPKNCELQDRYQKLKKDFRDNFNVDIEQLTEYRALRFISNWGWNYHQVDHRPWRVYGPAPITWLVWERGDHYMQNKLPDVDQIYLSDIQNLHRHGIILPIISNVARKKKGAMPGKLRGLKDGSFNGYNGPLINNCSVKVEGKFHRAPAWNIKCLHEVNSNQIALLQNYDLKTQCGMPLVRLVKGPKSCGKGMYKGKINYLPSHLVRSELQRILRAMRDGYEALKSGQSKISPIEFAADIQRWLISIHPFGDGNGRMTRYISDKIMLSFGLPFAPAGKLTNDLTNSRYQYRKLTLDTMFETLDYLDDCYDQYLKNEKSGQMVSSICRPISPTEKSIGFERDDVKKDREMFAKVRQDILELNHNEFDAYIKKSKYIGKIKKGKEDKL